MTNERYKEKTKTMMKEVENIVKYYEHNPQDLDEIVFDLKRNILGRFEDLMEDAQNESIDD